MTSAIIRESLEDYPGQLPSTSGGVSRTDSPKGVLVPEGGPSPGLSDAIDHIKKLTSETPAARPHSTCCSFKEKARANKFVLKTFGVRCKRKSFLRRPQQPLRVPSFFSVTYNVQGRIDEVLQSLTRFESSRSPLSPVIARPGQTWTRRCPTHYNSFNGAWKE